jgi:hypothetical protein
MAKLFESDAAGQGGKSVAIISDSYFIFEENGFRKGSLKRSEIHALARSTVVGMLPASGNETASGFCVDNVKSSIITFVASKERLLSEIPELASCRYWVPERFFKEKIYTEYRTGYGAKCLVLAMDGGFICYPNGKKTKLFSEDFWNAELHDDGEKNVNKKIEFVDSFYEKFVFRLLSCVAVLLLIFAGVLASAAVTRRTTSAIAKNESKVNEIKGLAKLRDEMKGFSSGKLSYLRRLKIVADGQPDSLIFSSFSIGGSSANEANLVGKCDSVAVLDEFVGKLKNESAVSNVAASNVVSTHNSVSFNLKVKFK